MCLHSSFGLSPTTGATRKIEGEHGDQNSDEAERPHRYISPLQPGLIQSFHLASEKRLTSNLQQLLTFDR